jgi:hypothetical protein
VVKLTLVCQILNTMNLIWAFNIDPAKDPETKEPIPVDVWDFEKVCLPFLTHYLPVLFHDLNREFSLDHDHTSAKSPSAAMRRRR